MTAIPDSLGSALAQRYALERVIGRGGMATVYLARDLKHGRSVAVKVLRPDLSATLGVERFLREIQIAARLQHPHVLTLIDSGQADGGPGEPGPFLYFVMPFVEGESLRARLLREGPLSPEASLAVLEEVADALEYAHRMGVVHRDIKPENILLSQGHAVVTDFGVAKAVSTAAERGLTRTGFPVGTVGYMSPEQAAGQGDLDARTDVFSLACVAYEMLIGETPGMWPSEEAGRLQRLVEAPPGHRERLDQLPGSVEQALVRGMMLQPARRLASPRELVTALRAGFADKPRYDGGRAREIVARAAELEATTPTAAGALSLGGIQQIAAQVGIPPEHVDDAAQELVRPRLRPRRVSPFVGAPTKLVYERVVPGTVSEAEYPNIVDAIRVTLGNVGQVSTLGGALTWGAVTIPNTMGRMVHVTITPHAGRTRIRIEENLTPLAGGYFGGIVGGGGGAGMGIGMGVGIGALHSPIFATVFLLSALTGSYTLARTLFRGTAQRRGEELADLLDRLAHYIQETGSGGRRALPR